MKFLRSVAFLFLVGNAFGQKEPLQGVFKYQATIMLPDTNVVYKQWNVMVRTNDTIVRVETDSEMFGTQVYLRNMPLNKAYLLLNMGVKGYAIQTDLNKNAPKKEKQYTIKKVKGKKTVAGIKCQKYHVTDVQDSVEIGEGYDCYFAKKISNKYLEIYREVPGLALDYYIPTSEGLVHYELQSFSREIVNRDLFGVPSDYEKISFEQFMNMFVGSGEE